MNELHKTKFINIIDTVNTYGASTLLFYGSNDIRRLMGCAPDKHVHVITEKNYKIFDDSKIELIELSEPLVSTLFWLETINDLILTGVYDLYSYSKMTGILMPICVSSDASEIIKEINNNKSHSNIFQLYITNMRM